MLETTLQWVTVPAHGKGKRYNIIPNPGRLYLTGDDNYQTTECHHEHQKVQIAEGNGGT